MKKIIAFVVMVVSITTSYAQLSVASDGTTYTQVFHANSSFAKKLYVWYADSLPYIASNRYNIYSYLVTPDASGTVTNAISIYGHADVGSTLPTRAMGVHGSAYGGYYNYGVYGRLCGTGSDCFGFGVYGTIYSSFTSEYDRYAGFFDGPVKVTGALRVNGSITTGNTYVYASPELSFDNSEEEAENTRNTETFVERISALQLGKYYGTGEAKQSTGGISQLTDNSNTSKEAKTISNEEADIANRMHYGLSAEQLENEFPELVIEDKFGEKYINYVEMVPLLVQSIKELSAKVTTLEEQLGNQNATKAVQKAKKQTTSIEDTGMEVVSMSQNRPNPFKDKSVIALNIPSDTKQAVINIYDMSGKQVQTIPVSERGKTNITVYASHLQPGMFIYSLLVDGKVQATRKMMVTE